MKFIKKILGLAFLVLGGFLVLFELSVAISESYLLREVKLAILFLLLLSVGFLLVGIGVKLMFPQKQKGEEIER